MISGFTLTVLFGKVHAVRFAPNDLRVLAPLMFAAIVAVACGASGEEPRGLSTTSTESASPASSPSEDAAAQAELESLHTAYWDAFVTASNGPLIDASLFDGIATTGVVERRLGYVQSELVARDARREGEPSIRNVAIEINDSQARIESCVDSSDWKLIVGDAEVPLETSGPAPSVMTAELTPDGWRINKVLSSKEAEITC